ncbi:uncharacterized protein LOC144658954 isoform X2 [Oculina patagonica]
MAAKQQEYTTLQEEQADYPHLQQDSYPLQTRDKQPQQAAYQPPQASYPPQQGSYPPQQGSYPPQQGSYPPQQASYPPKQAGYPSQQAGYPPQQAGYPPQQAGYPPQQGYPQPPPQRQATATDIIDQQPSLDNTVNVTFGESPVRAVCPHCRVTVVSTTHKVPGFKTCVCCVLLACIGCNAGCCLFPFCMDECLDVVHACPLCRNKIGVYQQEL